MVTPVLRHYGSAADAINTKNRLPMYKSTATATERIRIMSLNPGQRGSPTQQIFNICLEEHAKARPAANRSDMDGDALRQCLVQFKPGTAHMPVRGDQTHRAIAADRKSVV